MKAKKAKYDTTEDDQSNSANFAGPVALPTMTSFVDRLIKKNLRETRCPEKAQNSNQIQVKENR